MNSVGIIRPISVHFVSIYIDFNWWCTQCSLNCWFHYWIWLVEARPLWPTCWMKVGFDEYRRTDECARHDSCKNSSHLSPALPHTHTHPNFSSWDTVPPISNMLSFLVLFTGWVHSRSITSNRVWLWSGRWKGPCVQQRPLTSLPCYSCRYRFCSVGIVLLCVFSFVFWRVTPGLHLRVSTATGHSSPDTIWWDRWVTKPRRWPPTNTRTDTSRPAVPTDPSKSEHGSKSHHL